MLNSEDIYSKEVHQKLRIIVSSREVTKKCLIETNLYVVGHENSS